MTNHVLFAVVVAGGLLSAADAQPPATVRDPGDNVILVTLDGARTQEVFGGLDREVLASTLKADQPIEQSPTFTRYNAATREERRQKLMPFLWQLMATAGSIAGDQTIGSTVQLRNRLWFSYPGYAEILLGEPHDDTLKSNDPIRNPYTTVLERIRDGAEPAAGEGRDLRVVERHRRDRRARRGSDDRQRRTGSVRRGGSGHPRDRRSAARGAAAVGRHPPRRLHVPARDAPSRHRAAARAVHRPSTRPTTGRTTAATTWCSTPTPG